MRSLIDLAAERRALTAALAVACPNSMHWFAYRGVPCSPPGDKHPWGWVCLDRIEHEVTTRADRERQLQRVYERLRRKAMDEHHSRQRARAAAAEPSREAARSADAARAIARIHGASR